MKSNQIILAFDPGLRCGWAKLEHGRYSAGIIHGDEAIGFLIQATRLRLGAVVIENYLGGGFKDRHARYTILLVGKLLGACEALGQKAALQTSQEKDPFVTRAEVILGAPHTKHTRDDAAALAHLMSFEART